METAVQTETRQTAERIKICCFEAIKNYTNNFLNVKKLEDAPLPVQMAVEKMAVYSKRDMTVESESIADLSVTYREVKDFPDDVLSLIKPYRKVRF